MFRRALICTDFADGLHRLGNFLPSLAAGGMEQIVFLHSVPFWTKGQIPREDKEKVKQARSRLDPILDKVPEGLQVAVEVVSGEPTNNLLKVAKQHDSEVIIMGASPSTMLSDRIFGSTTMSVSKHTQIPIVTFPTTLLSAFTGEELSLRCQHLFRFVLIPYDGSQTADELVQEFEEYVRKRLGKGSLKKCLLAWIIDAGTLPEISKDAQVREAEEKLVPIKARLENMGLEVETEVRLGEPVPDILELAQMSDICAIAVASHTLGKIWEWRPSFTGEMLRRSCEPVIFFPPKG